MSKRQTEQLHWYDMATDLTVLAWHDSFSAKCESFSVTAPDEMMKTQYPSVIVNTTDSDNIFSWCQDIYQNDWIFWLWKGKFGYWQIFFKTEEQSTLFRLTWAEHCISVDI
jgi:hypothetical protein